MLNLTYIISKYPELYAMPKSQGNVILVEYSRNNIDRCDFI